jgi:MFS family permease
LLPILPLLPLPPPPPVPLWALSSVSRGGLAYSSREVGLLISFTGLPMVAFTILLFPPLARRLGYVSGFRLGMLLFSLFSVGVMLMPLLRAALPAAARPPLLPLLLLMTSCAKMASCMAFTCTFLLINAAGTHTHTNKHSIA